jgi:hypothetical protein
MNHKDSRKGFDIDIMQCREDVIRARQSVTLAEMKKLKDKRKKQTRETQVISGQKINFISETDKSTQSEKDKETAEIKLKNGLAALKKTKSEQAEEISTNPTKTTPSLINNTKSWTDIVRTAEDSDGISQEIPETELVTVKESVKALKTSAVGETIEQIKSKVQETQTHKRTDIYNDSAKSSGAKSINVSREQRDERQSEKVQYSQSNEVKFIEQVKSVRIGGEQSGNEEVPRFDLAEQIMAEQRKNSAAKRKAPGGKIVSIEKRTSESKTARQSLRGTGEEKQSYLLQQKIIARIVRQDIERFCAGKEPRGQRSFVD